MEMWQDMHVVVAGNVIRFPGAGFVWQVEHGNPSARCVLWLYGIGWSGGACSVGLSGTSCFASATAAACCVLADSDAQNGTVNKAAFSATTSNLAILLKCPPPGSLASSTQNWSPHAVLLRRFIFFLAHDFFEAGAEILEHDHGCVPSGLACDRSAGSRCAAGLIQPGNRHSISRPTGHGTHGT